MRGLQGQVDKLQLVDLVGELQDEVVVDGEPGGGALGVVEDGDQGLGQLVPELLLPQILKPQDISLEVFWRLEQNLLQERLRVLVVVHSVVGAERETSDSCGLCSLVGYAQSNLLIGNRGRYPAYLVAIIVRSEKEGGSEEKKETLWESVVEC